MGSGSWLRRAKLLALWQPMAHGASMCGGQHVRGLGGWGHTGVEQVDSGGGADPGRARRSRVRCVLCGGGSSVAPLAESDRCGMSRRGDAKAA